MSAQAMFEMTPVVFTSIRFGGISSTSLYRNTDGTRSITDPPHDAGSVSMSIDWTLDRALQTTALMGYIYEVILV